MNDSALDHALRHVTSELVRHKQPLALVGGLGVSIRGEVPVARAEDLLALKVLSMNESRPQDRIDAGNLLAVNPEIDLVMVRDLLARITTRGYHRDQDLLAKLEGLIATRP